MSLFRFAYAYSVLPSLTRSCLSLFCFHPVGTACFYVRPPRKLDPEIGKRAERDLKKKETAAAEK